MLTHEIEQGNCKICSFINEEVSNRIVSYRSIKKIIRKKANYEKNQDRFYKYITNFKFPEKHHTDILDDTETRKLRDICDCQTNLLKFHLLLSTTARPVLH